MVWLLIAQLHAFALPPIPMPAPPPSPILFQQAQEPRVLPSHRRGPHEGEDGAFCYRGPDEERSGGRHFYNCPCQFQCEMDGEELLQREADDCVTSCSKDNKQCLCHKDEQCDPPVQAAPR